MRKLVVFITGLLLIVACAETKQIVKPRELKQINVAYLYDSINYYYGDYTTFSTKFTAQVTNPKPVTIKGVMKIKRDSIIWISISPALNLEAVRCVFTPDSVMFVNRIDKTYYQGNYEVISKLAGISLNYQTIQSVLLNELIFYPFESKIDTLELFKTYNVSKKKNDVELKNYSYKERRQMAGKKFDTLVTTQSLVVGSDNFRIHNIEIEDQTKNMKAEIKYSMYNQIGTINFPNFLTFEVKSHKRKMYLMVNYDKQEFNIKQTYPFSISSKYKEFLK